MLKKKSKALLPVRKKDIAVSYDAMLAGVVNLLEQARRTAARTVNAVMTATYWEIGRRIIEHEQGGKRRAEYGEALLKRLAMDLTSQFGRGFSERNLEQMRLFYVTWQISQTVSAKFDSVEIAGNFPLSWSHYVLLMRYADEPNKRAFYETEVLRGGWSIRQLKRQMNSMFYERTLLSRNKAALLTKHAKRKAEDAVTPEEEVKDPFGLEFLDLTDEYSETELEAALVRHLETFLLELGDDFAFVGRQKRLRIDDEWYRVDLMFFHRRLRCLVIIDLKLGKFTHADAGQMHLYLNYAREHWIREGENPPVGIILCEEKSAGVVHYTLDNLPNKVLAAEYKTILPDEKLLLGEMERTRRMLEAHTPSTQQTKAKKPKPTTKK